MEIPTPPSPTGGRASPPDSPSSQSLPILAVTGQHAAQRPDPVALEEPLEIRLAWHTAAGREQRPISITMRTPGHDFALAMGFLFTEGIIQGRADIAAIYHCGPQQDGHYHNAVRVVLRPETSVDTDRLARHFYTTSSCGVCGKTSIDLLRATCAPLSTFQGEPIPAAVIHALPGAQRAAQTVFDQTGGLHAAALFDRTGKLLLVREDVGRHNAMDKLIGERLSAGMIAGAEANNGGIVLLSGRASFELVQKAAMAGIGILASVGAPSTLAVATAHEMNITLLGFVRDNRFNIYCGGQRIAGVS